MRRRFLLAAGTSAAVLACLGIVPAAAGTSSDRAASQPCPGTADELALGAKTPVLLVHGLNDSSQLWTKGKPSMTQAIETALGSRVALAYFDYHQVSTGWVTNPSIGPQLASCLNWLAARSKSQGGPGRVIIVAHSMGGLAVRCAIYPGCAGKAATNPSVIKLVITLDTPNLGTFPGLVAAGQWLCYSVPYCPGWLALAKTEAGLALDPGSTRLAQLPLLPAQVPVHAFAGKITLTTSLFGAGPFDIASGASGDIGDIAVPVASALAEMPSCGAPDPLPAGGHTCSGGSLHAGPGSGTTIENCGTIPISELDAWHAAGTAAGVLTLPCWHLTEVTDPVWQAGVVTAIQAAAPVPATPSAVYAVGEYGSVFPISAATNTAGKPIRVDRYSGTAVALTPDGATAYVTSEYSGTVTPVNTSTNTAGPPIHAGPTPTWIATTPDGKTAYVTNQDTGTVTPISTATNTAGQPIHIGGEVDGIAITPDGKTAYVTSQNKGTVTPINLAADTTGTPILVPGAYHIAITPDGKTAYVITTNGHVTPIRLATGTTGTPIPIGGNPDAIAITPDGKTAYVASVNATVTPINIASDAAESPIRTNCAGNGIAITPDGQTAYISCYYGSVLPITIATNTVGTPIPISSAIQAIATPYD